MKWTILYFYHDKPLHIHSLKTSNPNHQIISVKLDQETKEINWYNCDRFCLNKIRKLIHHIENENILFVEWDVLINKEILNIDYQGVFCKHSLTPEANPGWCWWPDVNKLPVYLQRYAHGTAPFSVIGIKKHILLDLMNPKFIKIFNQHIMAEVRFGTLINYLGYQIDSWPKELDCDNLIHEGIDLHDMKLTRTGIFHPVKISQ